MPRELVVVLLPYCQTGISDIVNGGITTYSLINVPHSNGKGLHNNLILLSLRFSCTSLYHHISLSIDLVVQGEVSVHAMKTYRGSVGIDPLILNRMIIGQPHAPASLPSRKEFLVPIE